MVGQICLPGAPVCSSLLTETEEHIFARFDGYMKVARDLSIRGFWRTALIGQLRVM